MGSTGKELKSMNRQIGARGVEQNEVDAALMKESTHQSRRESQGSELTLIQVLDLGIPKDITRRIRGVWATISKQAKTGANFWLGAAKGQRLGTDQTFRVTLRQPPWGEKVVPLVPSGCFLESPGFKLEKLATKDNLSFWQHGPKKGWSHQK